MELDKKNTKSPLPDAWKAKIILEELVNMDVSEEYIELIQGWMASDVNQVEKEKYLSQLFDHYFYYDRSPEKWIHEHLEMFSIRVGQPLASFYPARAEHHRLWRTVTAVAAAIIPLLMIPWFVRLNGGGDVTQSVPVQVTVSSTQPAQNEMILPDGSSVRICKNTKLTYADDFTENRSVWLDGEAYFTVVGDAEHPFTVNTDNLKVTVLGTEFNMKAYAGESQAVVSLVSGSVEVSNEAGSMTLSPMEELRYDVVTGAREIEKINEIVMDRWTKGRKELLDRPLPEALRDVADFYGKQLVIAADISRSKTVTTILKDDESLETVLYVIQRMTGDSFRFEVRGETIRITDK